MIVADDYEVRFEPCVGGDWFYTLVFYKSGVIAKKSVCNNYWLAAWWARRRIRNHKKGQKVLESR
jgi:hypothetical protein